MKALTTCFTILMISLSFNAFALNDDEELEFTGAVNEGNIKVVKRYVETMNVNLEDSYFAWTPVLMAAAKNQMEVLKYLVEKGELKASDIKPSMLQKLAKQGLTAKDNFDSAIDSIRNPSRQLKQSMQA